MTKSKRSACARALGAPLAILVSLALSNGLVACGSTANGPPSGDGGARIDGGVDLDGGAADLDGGADVDGGADLDGGASVDGGAHADGGGVTWRILPGQGLDVAGSSGGAVQLRIGVTRTQTQAQIGDGTDTSLAAGPFDRAYADGAFLLFFANTDQSKSGSDQTLTGADQVRFMSATRAFSGKTAGGTGPGSARTAWIHELGQPDLTLPKLDSPSDQRDHYFGRGLFIDYDGTSVASAYTVARSSPVPNTRIELRNRRLGTIDARASGGSGLSQVQTVWGPPDQIDDYDIGIGISGRNYTYINLGLIFVSANTLLDSSTYKVNGIIFFDPYFGAADIASLKVRSTRSQFDTALVTSGCQPTSSSFVNQTWRVYKVAATAGGACDIRVGVVFDGMGRAVTIYLGFPNGV